MFRKIRKRARGKSLSIRLQSRRPQVEVLEDRQLLSITNPLSQFPIEVDGSFSGAGEWSDTQPAPFHSPLVPGDTFHPTTSLADPQTNSLLYASLAPETPGGPVGDGLYLMYDYLARTNPNFAPGEFIADISFPITVGNGEPTVATVQIRGAQHAGGGSGPFFNVFVDVNGDGNSDTTAEALGMETSIGFGTSIAPFGVPPAASLTTPHLQVELEVPLRIPANFGPAFPADGIDPATGLYSPEPQFWTGGFAKDQGGIPGDPPGSAGLFRINPDASVRIDPSSITAIANVRINHPVNLNSNGLLPVQIFSTATFDATQIRLNTVRFNDRNVSFQSQAVDLNGDGRLDLVLNYHVRDLVRAGAIADDGAPAVIAGDLLNGTHFGGAARYRRVPR